MTYSGSSKLEAVQLNDGHLPILQKYITGASTRQAGSDIYQTADKVAAVMLRRIAASAPLIRNSNWSEAFTVLKTGLDPDERKQQAKVIVEFLS
jgi:hypothetical protein